MSQEKHYTAKQVAIEVLKKAEEVIQKYEASNSKKLDPKAPARSQKDADPDQGKNKVEKQTDPNKNPKEKAEGNNNAPGAYPQNEEKYSMEKSFTSGMHTVKYMGKAEKKLKKDGGIAAGIAAAGAAGGVPHTTPAGPVQGVQSGISNAFGKSEGEGDLQKSLANTASKEKGVHLTPSWQPDKGKSYAGTAVRSKVGAGEDHKKMQHEEAVDEHKHVLSQMKQMPKPNLPKSEAMAKGVDMLKSFVENRMQKSEKIRPAKLNDTHRTSAQGDLVRAKAKHKMASGNEQHELTDHLRGAAKVRTMDLSNQPKPNLPKSEK